MKAKLNLDFPSGDLKTKRKELYFNSSLKRNIIENSLTLLSTLFTFFAVLPLVLVLFYVLIKGGSQLNILLFTELPEPPGDDLISAGGVGNAVLGTFIITFIASLIAVPIGIGGGIYLAEYSIGGPFARFIRFGTNVLSGVPSIIAGVFVYGTIVSTKIIFGSNFSAIAGGLALSILMLPIIIKTTDEGLKLVPDDLRKGALGVGASKFITITRITLPAAFSPIATGIILAVARSAGETAPLIFTALFSFYWPVGSEALLDPIASLSVLIYNFALEPYSAQNELAWAASFILVLAILILTILARGLESMLDKKQ
ncbi:phosphate ABC transporter permease PstA [Prochlorococcus sp. MIT 1307]|uniref:phosphate ABC transporter permease PstA n=1 Tax=Prochlorococcus sp. MIT 1307 TaxID=3096219 RepID=UPI002A761B54|nr:phosphate ABC transporter permease PstA [Prochlorococcus sp. MIT 1307]